jgi:hypothetical protein
MAREALQRTESICYFVLYTCLLFDVGDLVFVD